MIIRIISNFIITVLMMSSTTLFAQNLYSKSYGKVDDPPLLYVHGGPRGNSTLFEGTTAEKLANCGFHVIVYDRRGEGRSVDENATLTFREAFDDLHSIIEHYDLKKVNIIGHSFGGIVSTLFTEAFPDKVDNLILVGALFSQQETYDHILDSCAILSNRHNDKDMRDKILATRSLDTLSAEYRKQCYDIAAKFGFFKMPNSTISSTEIKSNYEHGVFAKDNIRNDNAPLLFYKNESQVNIDTKSNLRNIKAAGVKLAGIYGWQDNIFSGKQKSDIKNLIGEDRCLFIDNCSHYPFVDQQELFIEYLSKLVRSE
ncbi:alpha/beta hydrolase [Sphingobacterium corticis]|uniref:Alpha/beta hydrolase n=1 Tax=Sphingobacterium corticis TaxID=1812823 RepID=A0ABW5NJY1_9SPHI